MPPPPVLCRPCIPSLFSLALASLYNFLRPPLFSRITYKRSKVVVLAGVTASFASESSYTFPFLSAFPPRPYSPPTLHTSPSLLSLPLGRPHSTSNPLDAHQSYLLSPRHLFSCFPNATSCSIPYTVLIRTTLHTPSPTSSHCPI